MADRIDVTALLARVDLVAVVGSYVKLKKVGTEYAARCPFHAEKTPSFYVVPAKGFCQCFGCGHNSDAIGFLQEIEGINFREACERLGAPDTQWTPNILERPKPPTIERITSKPPPDAGEPDMEIRRLGKPARTWRYDDASGGLLGFIARYDVGENGSKRKEIRCWTWGKRGEQAEGWACGHWSKPRPLYGLDRLAARPDAPVLIAEGEKACDAAGKLLPQYVAVTWPGGAQTWKHADFVPLRGRRVLLWPDADEPGRECMAAIARLLGDPRGLACEVKILNPALEPDCKANGWDAADALAEDWTLAQTVAWAKPRITRHEPPTAPQDAPEPEVAPVQPAAPEIAPEPASEPPAAEFPPEAIPERPKQRRKPRLVAVDGNTALAPDEEPLPVAMSEDALADAFATACAADWRYVPKWGRWLHWTGHRWEDDEKNLIDHLAVKHCRSAVYWPEAASLTPDGKRRIGQRRVAGAVRDLAKSDPRIAAKADQWDRDPLLLGTPNGIWDAAAGKLITGEVDQYITKSVAVSPAPGRPELWLRFLETITAGDADLIAYLQRAAGYSLTGETREQCLFFLYGTGQNGKGVFLTTIKAILGDYAKSCDADVFMDTGTQRHTTELARLRGARFVSIDETDQGCRFNEKRIKRLTGGGEIEARFMAQDNFEFMPQFKLWFAGNHKPQLRGVGKAMQRRLQLVPFTVTIPDTRRDDQLTEKLRAEYPQILQWMIEGCLRWQETGLLVPATVRDATAEYIDGQDTIAEWLDSSTEAKNEVSRPVAYKNYRAWMDGRGEKAWSSKAWWEALEQRGFALRRSATERFIRGLSLRISESPPDGPPSWHYDSDR